MMISSDRSRNPYPVAVCNISAAMPHADQLYSSRSRGKWVDKPYVIRLAPDGWKDKHGASAQTENLPDDHEADIEVASAESRASWARLIRKIYQGARRGRSAGLQKVWICDEDIGRHNGPDEVKSILRHLMKTGKSPPGPDPASFQLN